MFEFVALIAGHCLLLSSVVFSVFVITSCDVNQSHAKTTLEALPSPVLMSDKSPNGRSIKDNSNNSLDKSKRTEQKKDRESIRKEKDMYDIMRLHQINANIEYNKEVKTEMEKKEKGKLQTVGGVVGEIIAVIVSEVVKLFGNMVSDVAREVTAHGFVSIFKQFTDLTGISIPENII